MAERKRRHFLQRWFWSAQDPERAAQHLPGVVYGPDMRRDAILGRINSCGFNWKVYFVAASGFFTTSYNLFATNTIAPALAYIYWNGETDGKEEAIINFVTLSSMMLGMVIFGCLADRFGRRMLYGVELGFVILATIGMTQASSGFNNSMNIYGWIIFWRVVLGFGAGAEYPLSAVVTAEWASTRSRGRMMAAVFLMQSIGQLTAYAVTVWALMGICHEDGQNICKETKVTVRSKQAIDSVWRCVVGVGAFPALLAILLRWSIPESPRWIFEVEKDPQRALRKAEEVVGRDTRARSNRQAETAANTQPETTADESQDSMSRVGSFNLDSEDSVSSRAETSSTESPDLSVVQRLKRMYGNLQEALRTNGCWQHLLGTSLCWFLVDIVYYGLGLSNPRTIGRIWLSRPAVNGTLPANGTVAVEGLLLDWNSELTNTTASIYGVLYEYTTRGMITISTGSVAGSVSMIFLINRVPRVEFMTWCFVALAGIFLITGATFFTVYETNRHALTIVFYSLAQFVFNIGPNTLTWIIPAEIFRTEWRGTFYGVAAAAGKLGAFVIQLAIYYERVNNPFGPESKFAWLLMSFFFIMLLGGAIGWIWIPEVQIKASSGTSDEENGRGLGWVKNILFRRWDNRELEDIANEPDRDQVTGFRRRVLQLFNQKHSASSGATVSEPAGNGLVLADGKDE